MNDLFQGLWLSGVGMAATVVICAAVISLVWLLSRVLKGRPRPARLPLGAEPPEIPMPVLVAAAVAAVMEGRPYQVTWVKEGNSAWIRAGREDLARTEGSFPDE